MKGILFLTTTLLFIEHSFCQSLNGFWKGKTEHSIWMLNSKEDILEIEITNDSVISGVIHSYYTKGRYSHVKISGTINWKDSLLNIIDEEEISHNINSKWFESCFGTMNLKLTRHNNLYVLNGVWKDKSRKLFHCPNLKVSFEKEYKDEPEFELIGTLNRRRTDIQKVIELTNDEIDSVKFSLYDNGEIDGDTVTVFFNDSLVLHKQRLSERPVEFYISLDKSKNLQKIKLFADNLGSIPPNTALLIITTRKNRYLITLSSDYLQNGSVELFLKE